MDVFRQHSAFRLRALLLALAIPLIAAGAVFVWQDFHARRDATIAQVRLQSAQVNAQLEDFVHTVQAAAEVYTRAWTREYPATFTDVRALGDEVPPNMYLEEFVANQSGFSGASIIGVDGTLRVSSKPFIGGVKISAPEFFQRARASGLFTVSDVFVADEDSPPGALFAQPLVYGPEGIQGFLVLESTLSTISASLDMSVGFPKTAKSGIFDSTGKVLAGAGHEPPHPGMAAGKDISASGVWAQAVTRPAKEWFGPGLDKVDRIIFFGYPENTPWITTVAYAQSELFDPLWNRLYVFGGALAATAIAMLWVGEIFIRRERRGLQQLNAERTTLKAVMDGATDGIQVLDGDRDVSFVNRRFGELFELKPSSVVGQPAGLVAGQIASKGVDRTEAEGELQQAMSSSGDVVTGVLRLSGSPPAEIEITSYPIRNGNGPLGRAIVYHDVTKSKSIHRMKPQFLATASHQLRTPMTSILALSEMLVSRAASPEQRLKWAQHIRNQADRMNATITSMLNVSPIESGRLDLEVSDCDAIEVCESVISDIRDYRQNGRLHQFELRIPRSLRWIRADEHRFRQVVENLVDNAVKYTPEGGLIAMSAEKRDDGLVQFSLSDTGRGIAPEEQKNLFTPFYRVPGATTADVAGTGLGLYIAKNLVELHGGNLWVESVPGKGSTFFFTLPMAQRGGSTRPIATNGGMAAARLSASAPVG